MKNPKLLSFFSTCLFVLSSFYATSQNQIFCLSDGNEVSEERFEFSNYSGGKQRILPNIKMKCFNDIENVDGTIKFICINNERIIVLGRNVFKNRILPAFLKKETISDTCRSLYQNTKGQDAGFIISDKFLKKIELESLRSNPLWIEFKSNFFVRKSSIADTYIDYSNPNRNGRGHLIPTIDLTSIFFKLKKSNIKNCPKTKYLIHDFCSTSIKYDKSLFKQALDNLENKKRQYSLKNAFKLSIDSNRFSYLDSIDVWKNYGITEFAFHEICRKVYRESVNPTCCCKGNPQQNTMDLLLYISYILDHKSDINKFLKEFYFMRSMSWESSWANAPLDQETLPTQILPPSPNYVDQKLIHIIAYIFVKKNKSSAKFTSQIKLSGSGSCGRTSYQGPKNFYVKVQPIFPTAPYEHLSKNLKDLFHGNDAEYGITLYWAYSYMRFCCKACPSSYENCNTFKY